MVKVLKNTVIALSMTFAIGVTSGHSATEPKNIALLTATTEKGGTKAFCQKADVKKGIFSVRSFNGNFCNMPAISAVALMVCKDPEFTSSQCYKKAKAVIGSTSPEVALKRDLSNLKDKGAQFVCKIANKLPASVQAITSKFCK